MVLVAVSHRSLVGVVAMGLLVGATACTSTDAPPSSRSTAPEATTTTSEAAPDPPAAPTEPAPLQVPLDDRIEVRLERIGAPDWLAAGFGSVWVKEDSGTVVRIDPATNAVVAEIATGDDTAPLCQGLGVGAEAVWSCSGTDLVRIDPATNAVAETLPIGKSSDQGQLAFHGGRVWVLLGDGTTMVGVDEATNRPGPPVTLGTRCTELAAGLDAIWAACPVDGVLLGVDTETGEVLGEAALPDARTVAVGEQVWVGYEQGLARVDPGTFEVLSVTAGAGNGGGAWAGPEGVWVRAAGTFLQRLDPATGRVIEQVPAPDLPSGGSVLAAYGSLWATAFDDAALVRLSPGP